MRRPSTGYVFYIGGDDAPTESDPMSALARSLVSAVRFGHMTPAVAVERARNAGSWRDLSDVKRALNLR